MSNGLIKYAAYQRVGFIKTAEMEKEAIAFLPLLGLLAAGGGIAWGAKDAYQGAKKMYETGGKDGKADLGFGLAGMIPAAGWLAKGVNWGRKAGTLGRFGQGASKLFSLPNIGNLGTRIGQSMQQASKAGQGLINSNRWNKYTAPVLNSPYGQTGLNAIKNNWGKVRSFGRNLDKNIPAALGNSPQWVGRQIKAFNPFSRTSNAATQQAWNSTILGTKAMDTVLGPENSTNPYLQQTGEGDWQNNQSTSGQGSQSQGSQNEVPNYNPHSTNQR